MSLKVGDRVRVKDGKAHDEMTNNKTGTVVKVSTPALGIKFDGMDEIHKWYTEEELLHLKRKAAAQLMEM